MKWTSDRAGLHLGHDKHGVLQWCAERGAERRLWYVSAPGAPLARVFRTLKAAKKWATAYRGPGLGPR